MILKAWSSAQGLLHYGTPLWLDNQFLNSSYPARVAAYAAEFTRRYRSLVTHYTPLNEPWVTVPFCGQHGTFTRGHTPLVEQYRALIRGDVKREACAWVCVHSPLPRPTSAASYSLLATG